MRFRNDVSDYRKTLPMQMISPTYTMNEFDAWIALPENQDRRFELIYGEIIEKMPTEEHGHIVFVLSGELYIYFKANPIGRVGVEVIHRQLTDPHNARMPDLSIIFDLESSVVKKGAVPRMPDIAVEVKSPDDTYLGIREKALFYINHGTQMVWLIYPEKRLVEVYKPNEDMQLLDINEMLIGDPLLPNFALPLKTIFGND